MTMSRTVFSRSLLGLLLAAMLGVFAATPALACGAENWQIGFAGTGVAPSTGFRLRFLGMVRLRRWRHLRHHRRLPIFAVRPHIIQRGDLSGKP